MKIKAIMWYGGSVLAMLHLFLMYAPTLLEQEYEWLNLVDQDLSEWEVFMGVPHTSVEGVGAHPRSEDVHVGVPLGLNNDPKQVFTVIQEEGEDVIKVTGEIYGGLTTKKSFANYHLKMKVRWGEKKWPPRLDRKRDAGLLYHCTGEHGAFWNVWKRCLEFQIQETDTGDFIGIEGANAWVRTGIEEADRNKHDSQGQWRCFGRKYNNWTCTKSDLAEKPNGEWNSLDLYVFGNSAIHVVNGQVVMGLKDAFIENGDQEIPLTEGQIQLQSEAAEVYYKDVKIRNIEALPKELALATGLTE